MARSASRPSSRRDTMTIAQRFNAGRGQSCVAPVPKGRLNPSSAGRVPFRPALGRPFGTWGHLTAKPSVETLGYSRTSLRDNDRRPGQGNLRKGLPLTGFEPTQSCRSSRPGVGPGGSQIIRVRSGSLFPPFPDCRRRRKESLINVFRGEQAFPVVQTHSETPYVVSYMGAAPGLANPTQSDLIKPIKPKCFLNDPPHDAHCGF
jgi:hypothetical protein